MNETALQEKTPAAQGVVGRAWPVAVLRHRMTILYILFMEYLLFPIAVGIRETTNWSMKGIWDQIVRALSVLQLDGYLFFFVFALVSPYDVIFLLYGGTIGGKLEIAVMAAMALVFWAAVVLLIVKSKTMPLHRLTAFYLLLSVYFWFSLEGMLVAIYRFMTV